MTENKNAGIIPFSLGMGLIFIPKLVMLDGKNGFASALLGLMFALLAAALPVVKKRENAVISFLMFAVCVFAGGMILRIYSALIKRVLLPEYGLCIIAAAMLAAALYGGAKGRAAGERLAAAAAPVLLACTALCLIPAAQNMDIVNIAIIPEDPVKMLKNGIYAGFVYGFALCTAKAEKRGLCAFYLLVTGLLAIAAAGIWQARFARVTEQPILDLMYAGYGTSAFIRRQEGLILGIITVSVYFMLEMLTARGTAALGRGTARKGGYAVCAALIFICAMLPSNTETAEAWLKIAAVLGGLLFLTGISVWRREK